MQDLVEFSRARIEKGSKSFALAARLFPPETRESAYMLYAWCRHCDDLVDDQVLGHARAQTTPAHDSARETVDRLEQQTRAALAGQPSEPAFEALQKVALRHEIPDAYPLELIAGFRMDADGRTYDTIEDVLEYCYHVAGVVGVMMAMVMGVRDSAVLRRASDLGIAFQLTNIARDVVPDHAAGRVYLPRQWLDEAGLSREDMAIAANRDRLFDVVARLLDLAEPYYVSSRVGMANLPPPSTDAYTPARWILPRVMVCGRRRACAPNSVTPHPWPNTGSSRPLAHRGMNTRQPPPGHLGAQVMLVVVAEMKAREQ
jgi:phytoene synthase